VHKLQNAFLAETYCDRVNQRLRSTLDNSPGIPGRFGSSENVYTTLVKVLLEKEIRPGSYQSINRGPDDPQWKEIALLLSRKQDAIHPLEALKLLPGEVGRLLSNL